MNYFSKKRTKIGTSFETDDGYLIKRTGRSRSFHTPYDRSNGFVTRWL